MEPPEASSSLACVVLTTMGRVLLQCERDTTLPFHYKRLALLLASCLQFATSSQDHVRLELQGGFSVVLSVDAPSSIACAVIVKNPNGTELARLQSLVVLREFTRVFKHRVDKIVDANRAAAAEMAEAYTLSSALGGGAGADGADGYEDEGGTLEEFLPFHHEFVARVLETVANDHKDRDLQPQIRKCEDANVLQTYLVNGETASVLSLSPAISPSAELSSHTAQELVRRATRALQLAFPVLSQTSLLQRGLATRTDGALAQVASSSRPNSTTLVALLKTQQRDRPFYYVAIRMFHLGVFAAVVHYSLCSPCDRFRGKACELLADGNLPRVLISDPRGAALLRLLHDAERSASFSLHVGSDGVSETIAEHLERQLLPWRVRFETELTEV